MKIFAVNDLMTAEQSKDKKTHGGKRKRSYKVVTKIELKLSN